MTVVHLLDKEVRSKDMNTTAHRAMANNALKKMRPPQLVIFVGVKCTIDAMCNELGLICRHGRVGQWDDFERMKELWG